MIGKLFTKRFLSLFALLFLVGSAGVKAQTTSLVTPVPLDIATGHQFSLTGTNLWDAVVVEVENTNICPIALTNVSTFHWGNGITLNSTFFTAEDSTYDLWMSTTSLTGFANVTTGTGWQYIGNSGPIPDTFNRVTQIFSGLNVKIAPNSKVRFAIRYKCIMSLGKNLTPLSQSQNGITLTSGGASNVWSGVFPNLSNTAANTTWGSPAPNPYPNTFHFIGAMTFKQLAPDPPIADISLKPKHACIGDDVILKASHPKPNAAGVFIWRNAGGTIIAQNSTGTHQLDSVTLNDAGRYFVTYKLCGEESLADSITLIVNNPPAPTISGKFDYCLNEQFEAVTVHGTSPKWYYESTGGSPVPVTPTINTSSPNTLVYYVSQTDAYGCESQERAYVRLRAAKKPFAPIVTSPIYYCEEVPADPLHAIGDTLRWYYFPTGGIPTVNAPTPNTSVNAIHNYYVTQTIDGCESDRSEIEVRVTFKPNGIVLADKTQMCAKDTLVINYYGSADTTSQYNWILPPQGTTILNGGFDQGPLEMRLDTPGTFRVKLRVGHVGCLSDEYFAEVLVNPLPYGRISFKDDVCLGQPELMESLDYTPGLDTFNWNFGGGTTTHFTTDQGPYGVFWSTPGEKYLEVVFVDEGCVDTARDTVMVHPKPDATIVGSVLKFDNSDINNPQFRRYDYAEGDTICASDSIKVSVQTVEPGASYKWTPARFFEDYGDQSVTYARVDFASNIYVEVEDVYGCTNKDSIKVETKSCCEMTFPNAFTPNGDGRNDLFRPITIGRREIKTFRVVNRYGEAVYETKTNIGWDGTMNGKPMDLGTYFYIISFVCDGQPVDQSGDVVLIR